MNSPTDERLADVLRASERLVMAQSLDEVVAILRDTARATVGAEGVAVIVEQGGYCSYVAEDAAAPLWQGQRFLAEQCISGWVMRHGETVALNDVQQDARIPQHAYAGTFVRSLVMVPLGHPAPVAALGAYWSDVRTHAADTLERLESLARLATIAIENARLTQARNRAAAIGAAQQRILQAAVQALPLQVALGAICQEVSALSPLGLQASIQVLSAPGAPGAAAQAAPVCWSTPIQAAHGAALGTLSLHHHAPCTPLPADLEIIGFAAHTVGLLLSRHQAQEAVQGSEERLRLAVEHADVGFWDVDLLQNTVIWPPLTKALFGISAEVPVTLADFYNGLHPDDRDATVQAFEAATDPARRALYDVDYRAIGREDGVVRWLAAKGRGLFDGAGRCVRVTGTVVQITARKLAEEQLRELNTTLERRVAEAVAERSEVQEALRQSQKMESLGQLTGGVAHDFNNLLTPIIGTLDLLQRRAVGGEREQRLIAGALQSADRAKVLVQRLLAFARRQPLQAVAVDVAKLVNSIGGLVASTTGPLINVVLDAPAGLPPAVADPNQLEMALLNLAVNARDAMPSGGTLRLCAHTEQVAAGHRSRLAVGEYLCLSVADTGSGMSPATLARAVEPFFSTKGVGKGTGLGLSMVHGLALQLNGALTLQSAPGAGTRVELWLPRSSSLPAVALAGAEPAVRGAQGAIVLLVDDEALVRASTAYMLVNLGYQVLQAASGEQALALLEGGQHLDVLVTDHLMPGIDGCELARRVRAARPGTAVLLVSGYAELAGLDPALPRLAKPFRQRELAAALSQRPSGALAV